MGALEPLKARGSKERPGERIWKRIGDESGRYRLCANYWREQVCNWAVPNEQRGSLCQSCRLTAIIPDLAVPEFHVGWARLEAAKRRLLFGLNALNLPVIGKDTDPENGIQFRFLADLEGEPRILTGHDEGIITLNLAEADDVERERQRVSMHEPYRTLLGHFRHEIGHYYWDRLIHDSPRLSSFRDFFGDERQDYQGALDRHYYDGPPTGWEQRHVSAYASMHPWEDWAETWAHYLHMTDTLETAADCGLALEPARQDEPAMPRQPKKPAREQKFDEIINAWFPLTYVLNSLNRGMGLADAYPFALSPPAIEKLRFVHETICARG